MVKVASSSKFCVVVCKVISALVTGGSIGQSRFVCQVWCTGIQGISALILERGPLAKVGSSAKFCVVVFKASLFWYLGGGVPLAKVWFICQLLV